mmetsp:Transcript_5588/g.12985  ORF Transcript_5588/g.12985 Transcript_5588/m.12985 type:complete len:86 (+) Transcript_5588:1394-1651(+)
MTGLQVKEIYTKVVKKSATIVCGRRLPSEKRKDGKEESGGSEITSKGEALNAHFHAPGQSETKPEFPTMVAGGVAARSRGRQSTQ